MPPGFLLAQFIYFLHEFFYTSLIHHIFELTFKFKRCSYECAVRTG